MKPSAGRDPRPRRRGLRLRTGLSSWLYSRIGDSWDLPIRAVSIRVPPQRGVIPRRCYFFSSLESLEFGGEVRLEFGFSSVEIRLNDSGAFFDVGLGSRLLREETVRVRDLAVAFIGNGIARARLDERLPSGDMVLSPSTVSAVSRRDSLQRDTADGWDPCNVAACRAVSW